LGTAIQSRFIKWTDPESAYILAMGQVPLLWVVYLKVMVLLSTDLFTNPSVFEAVRLRGGGSSYPLRPENVNNGLQYYEMNGMEVWKQVIQYQPTVIRNALAKIRQKKLKT